MKISEVILQDARLFQRSRVILTASVLDLFTDLEQRPAGAADLATRVGSEPRATTRLLDALVTFGLLEKRDGIYRVTESGAFLSSRHPESVRPMILHQDTLWDAWSGLTETVRRGGNPGRRPLHQRGGETLRAFIGAMHVVGLQTAAEVAAACDPLRFERLLDVGGGPGTYTAAFLRLNPALTAVLFDLPEVIPMAAERLEREGLLGRVTLVAGDFYQDELPGGCDAALLSAIIHQNSPSQNVDLYRSVHRALTPAGVVLIRDHIMDEDRTSPAAGALFALNMLVGTEGGDTYTFAEVRETLQAAGFGEVRLLRQGERMEGLVEARKAAV